MSTIPLPWTAPPVTQNDRNDRRTGGARKIAAALEEARWAVRAARLDPIVGAVVTLHWRIPDRRRRDADNLAPTLKVVQDALVKEAVLADDSWMSVPRSGCEIHPPTGEPAAMWLTLTDVTPYEVRP